MLTAAAISDPVTVCQHLANDDQAMLQLLVKHFYSDLYKFSFKYVKSQEVAEELTQDIFIHLWENRKTLNINSALKAYLFTMAKNRSLNYLKSRIARLGPTDEVPETYAANAQNPEETLTHAELEKVVADGINALPEKCRIVFTLSRQEGMSYAQIAEELNISPKTVDAHMTTALKKLRTFVRAGWPEALISLLLLIFT